MIPDSRLATRDSRPGRSCPPSYGYAPASLARDPELIVDTLYVVGGLYGNRPALATVLDLARAEGDRTAVVFNGDFNWFNVDAEGFESVNRVVLEHIALRGNVETELASDDPSAGCGCAYPASVGDAEVERSNAIIGRLREASRAFPALRQRLGELPSTLIARVGESRIAIVHGDAEALAGWGFSQDALADRDHRSTISRWFDEARVDIFASSHTCLPVVCDFSGGRVLINNGAAGMPNFHATRYGVVTRISTTRASDSATLYALRAGGTHVAAVSIHYDTARFEREFLSNWPEGSPAHVSYHGRITRGPGYAREQAILRHATAAGTSRPHALSQESPT